MDRAFPEKDVQVIARLLGKLEVATSDFAKAKAEFDSVNQEYEALRSHADTRGSYIDVLKEIASELGEEIEEHDFSTLESLEQKVNELKDSLNAKKAEAEKLGELAEKLKASSPDIYDYVVSTLSATASTQKKPSKSSKSTVVENTNSDTNSKAAFELPTISRSPEELQSVFEMDALRQNPQLKRRGTVEPTVIFDAFNITQLLKRYNTDPVFGTDHPRNQLVCDLDYMSGEIQLPFVVVFDTQFVPSEDIHNRVTISSVPGRTSPDKAASNRMILRLIEEAQLERKPIVLVTNDVPLSREAASLGAINLTLQEVFSDA